MLKRMVDEEKELDLETTEPALNTRVSPHVRVINGALDEDPGSPTAVVLNGRIDSDTLRFLKVDSNYQRPLGDRSDIYEALKSGTIVPSIDIGVRGQDFGVDGDDYIIKSPAYIIDGWQRVGTALRILEDTPHHPLRIFATIHFGSDEIWERHRFTELNKNIKKVSPNLHLRNMRDGNDAIATLYGLCFNTKDFPLYKKVSWSQNMHRGDLMAAVTLARTARVLHGHHGMKASNSTEGLAAALLTMSRVVSLNSFRKNVTTFFEVMDECFDLRLVEFRKTAPQVKHGFLATVARVFSRHTDFWVDAGGRHLFVAADTRRKLAKFPINDPHVKNLAGTGGAATQILFEMLCTHLDSGKRTGRMTPRAR